MKYTIQRKALAGAEEAEAQDVPEFGDDQCPNCGRALLPSVASDFCSDRCEDEADDREERE